MLAGTACYSSSLDNAGRVFQGTPENWNYTIRGLAYDGTPEPLLKGNGAGDDQSAHLDGFTPRDIDGGNEDRGSPLLGDDGTTLANEQIGHTPSVTAAEAIDIPTLICSSAWDCATALRIATCESGLQPWAENGRFKGLFQLDTYNGGWFAHYGYDVADWADPATNVAVAYALWRDEGWAPWQCW